MSRQSLGLIETVGMAAAVEAADVAVKAASVTLVGYELTQGAGMVTVKLEGEIGAVNAAVAAAISAASRVGNIYAHKVIARSAQPVGQMIHSRETVGVMQLKPEALAEQHAPQAEEVPIESAEEKAGSEPDDRQPEALKKALRAGGKKAQSQANKRR